MADEIVRIDSTQDSEIKEAQPPFALTSSQAFSNLISAKTDAEAKNKDTNKKVEGVDGGTAGGRDDKRSDSN